MLERNQKAETDALQAKIPTLDSPACKLWASQIDSITRTAISEKEHFEARIDHFTKQAEREIEAIRAKRDEQEERIRQKLRDIENEKNTRVSIITKQIVDFTAPKLIPNSTTFIKNEAPVEESAR